MGRHLSRREWLAAGGTAVASGLFATATRADDERARSPFRYCLNTSTIRGDDLDLVGKIEIAAEAGYDAIEPWLREIGDYVDNGGNLDDLRKRIGELGLTVESAIGFARWIVDDETERRNGLERAKREMEMVRRLGGTRLAAPPTGATRTGPVDLDKAAERYRVLLEAGERAGVVPQVEVWGFSKTLSRLGEAAYVAVESGHPAACILPDVFHLYKGGSDFTGLKLLGKDAIHVFHLNDYPGDVPREKLNDARRVYPGDGAAPLIAILRTLHANGFDGALSLELFNREYWKQEPLAVARTGLEKMRAATSAALAAE